MEILITDACIACGACEVACPEVFHVVDKAIVNKYNLEGNEECAQEAAEGCPVNAIVIR